MHVSSWQGGQSYDKLYSKTRFLLQDTKIVDCPAKIAIKEVIHLLNPYDTLFHRLDTFKPIKTNSYFT